MQKTKRILVVDDNKDGADMTALLLRKAGHEVRVAYSGIRALELAREQKPSVALIDLGMPGIDGYRLAQNLRQFPETAKSLIIAITGYGLPADRARSEAVGIDLHLLKPVDGQQLLQLIEEKSNFV